MRRVAALCEVAGVFLLGALGARFLTRTLGVPSVTLRTLETGQAPDFLLLAWSTAVNLIARYGLILALAFAIGWWRRRLTPREYGVTASGIPLARHAAIAALLFAVGGLLPELLLVLRQFADLGAEPAQWARIDAVPRTFTFWLYMAVSSYALVPIVEELFARGYVQTRLGEDFGPAAAIVMTALMFALSHQQYFVASPIGIGMVVSIVFGSLLAGYARHATGSLIPAILAHAIGNVPFRTPARIAVLVLMLVVIVIGRRAIAAHARALLHLLRDRRVIAGAAATLAMTLIVLAQIALAPPLLLPTAVLALAAALWLARPASPAPR